MRLQLNQCGGFSRPNLVCFALFLPFFVLFFISGCTPAGPRALLEGEQLIQKNQFEAAVKKLEKATELLPNNAQAWNHLGMALHLSNRPEEAIQAYKRALSIDNNLGVAHYNLGCIYLEMDNSPTAVSYLTTYTLISPHSAEGWLRLGYAQIASRLNSPAVTSFQKAIDLNPTNSAAYNGLGVAQYRQNKFKDALASLNTALAKDPKNPDAILNQAVVYQAMKNYGLAWKKYQQYLALNPSPEQVKSVQEAMAGLLKLAPATTPVVAPNINAPASPQTTNSRHSSVNRPEPAIAAPTNSLMISQQLPEKTDPPPKNTPLKPSSVASTAHTHPTLLPVTPATSKPLESSKPSVKPPPSPTTRPSESAPVLAESPPVTPSPALPTASALPPVSSLPLPSAASVARSEPVPAKPVAVEAKSIVPTPEPASPPAPQSPRYRYSLAPVPPAGNRNEALLDCEAAESERSQGYLEKARDLYLSATRKDPSLYDAYFNLGVVASSLGNLTISLSAFEMALKIKPDSALARYNFGMVLNKAGLRYDAVAELQKSIQTAPDLTSAHLALANILAHELNQPERAAEHYRAVLDQNPSHPQALEIRKWLRNWSLQHPSLAKE